MLHPINKYKPPNLPTMQEMQANPAPLAQMPNRWRKKAAVVMCASFIGAAAMFSSCDALGELYPQWRSYTESRSNTEEDDWLFHSNHNQAVTDILSLRFHHGGAASPPFYVVHLTEAEALDIIRTQLEAAGLDFGTAPPNYSTYIGRTRFESSLFDNSNNVAIVKIPGFGSYASRRVGAELNEQADNIVFGVFRNPSRFVTDSWYRDTPSDDTPSAEAQQEAYEEARPILLERLNEQIEEFIELLREKGIL